MAKQNVVHRYFSEQIVMMVAPWALAVGVTFVPAVVSLHLWVALAELVFFGALGAWIALMVNRGVVVVSAQEVQIGIWSRSSVVRSEITGVLLARDRWILSRQKVPVIQTMDGEIRLEMFAFLGSRSVGSRLYNELTCGSGQQLPLGPADS